MSDRYFLTRVNVEPGNDGPSVLDISTLLGCAHDVEVIEVTEHFEASYQQFLDAMVRAGGERFNERS